MAKTFYDELGVEPTATQDEIKASYRRLSKTCHPDLFPGDEDAEQQFRDITKAYEVLSDPDQRAYYDEHGCIRDAGIEQNQNAALYGVIQQAMNAALGEMTNADTQNMIDIMRSKITAHKVAAMAQMSAPKGSIEQLRRCHKRVTRKDGDNIVAAMLQSQIDAMENAIRQAEDQLALDDKAIEFLKDFSYQVDAQTNPTSGRRYSYYPDGFGGTDAYYNR